MIVEQAHAPRRVAEHDEVFAEQTDAHGAAIWLHELGRMHGRNPVLSNKLAHRRSRPDMSQQLIVFFAQHCSSWFSADVQRALSQYITRASRWGELRVWWNAPQHLLRSQMARS